MRTILIIIPPVSRVFRQYRADYCNCLPMGELYVATMLDRRGYKARVFWPDYDYRRLHRKDVWVEIVKVISEFSPDFLGLGFTTQEYASAKRVADIAERINKKMVIIAGGHHPSALPEETMEEIPSLDIVIRGESEYAIVDVVEAVADKSPLSCIIGVSYRHGDKIVSNPDKDRIRRLDDLPFPKRDLILNLDSGFNRLIQPIVDRRGCVYNCSMCSDAVLGKDAISRSPENVAQEVEKLYRNDMVTYFSFLAPTFTLDEEWVREICGLIKTKKLKTRWDCTTRVDRISHRVVKTMKDAGCYRIFLGAESGSEKILNYFNKQFNLEQIGTACEIIRKVGGIHIRLAFLVGYPQETDETLDMTEDLISRLPYDSAYIDLLVPYPGTRIYKDWVRKNGTVFNTWGQIQPFADNLLIKSNGSLRQAPLRQRYHRMQRLLKKKSRRLTLNRLSSGFYKMPPMLKIGTRTRKIFFNL